MVYFLKTSQNNIRLDVSTVCQLKCPLCSTGKGLNKRMVVGWGYLKFRNFKKFIEQNSDVERIEISNYGEIFLNPELKEIIEYASLRGICLTANNGVNLNTLSDDMAKCLVKYKFWSLSVSLDGATNKTYRIYRRGGDFNKVIKNIEKINHYKKKYKSEFPKLRWQFVIFGHNEHELPMAKRMAEKLNMGFNPKYNWDPLYSPVADEEFVRNESGRDAISMEEYFQKGYQELQCYQLWLQPQINWDGKFLGCCSNIFSDFGNVFQTDFKECLSGEKYIYAKKMLLGKVKPRKDIPCCRCRLYDNKLPQRFLNQEYLKEKMKGTQ